MNSLRTLESVPTPRRSHRRRRGAGEAVRHASGFRTKTLEAVALVAIAVLLVLGAFLTSGAGVYSTSAVFSCLEVQSGDTLWTLAEAHPVDGLTTSQVADLLAEKNRLHGGVIVQGQDLLVPAPAYDQKLAAR